MTDKEYGKLSFLLSELDITKGDISIVPRGSRKGEISLKRIARESALVDPSDLAHVIRTARVAVDTKLKTIDRCLSLLHKMALEIEEAGNEVAEE